MNCFILILIQFLIFQNALSREITSSNNNHNQLNTIPQQNEVDKRLIIIEDRQRSITDLWNNIKNSAKAAWNSLKSWIEKTKEKVATWVQHIKERAETIKTTLEEKLTKLRERIKCTVKNVLGSEKVQTCIKQKTEDFDHILIEIINKISTCISHEVSNIPALEESQIKSLPNDTEFMEELEKKLNICKENMNAVEECLFDVKFDIIKETEDVANEVLQHRTQTRGITDDILDAIVTCSTDGLIEATAVITAEAVNILQCIVQHGEPSNVTRNSLDRYMISVWEDTK